jgi:hypothetical protein
MIIRYVFQRNRNPFDAQEAFNLKKINLIFCTSLYILFAIAPFMYTVVSFHYLGFTPKLTNFATLSDIFIIIGPTFFFIFLGLVSSRWIQSHFEGKTIF